VCKNWNKGSTTAPASPHSLKLAWANEKKNKKNKKNKSQLSKKRKKKLSFTSFQVKTTFNA